jgi:hypothetical protein
MILEKYFSGTFWNWRLNGGIQDQAHLLFLLFLDSSISLGPPKGTFQEFYKGGKMPTIINKRHSVGVGG